MNTPQESSRSQPGAFASPPTACDRYHEYTFGKRDIHWDQWLYKDDPRDVAADNSEEPILPDGDEEFVAGPENEGAGEAEASDASSSDDEKSWESDCNTDSHSEGKRITEDDMTFAKRLAVLTYPGEQFVQLPQFKRYLAELSREDMLSILRRDWELDKAVAKRVRVVTTFTFTHPSRRMQRIIERACGGTLEEESEAEFDLDQALRAKDILAEMFPGDGIHDAFVAELYGSAIVVGGPGGKGYGLECVEGAELGL
ncbi:hypothetical protein BDW62DRAFT_204514 [Aspergillus aurantiobrunneus]